MVSALIGGPAGKNGKISRQRQSPGLRFRADHGCHNRHADLCFTLINAIYAIPQAVIGGLEIYLRSHRLRNRDYGHKKVNFRRESIALIATIMVMASANMIFMSNPVRREHPCTPRSDFWHAEPDHEHWQAR